MVLRGSNLEAFILIIVFLLSIISIRVYKDYAHPVVLFISLWCVVVSFNVILNAYIDVGIDALFFITILLLVFFLFSLPSLYVINDIELNYNKSKVDIISLCFQITTLILFLSFLIYAFEMLRYHDGVAAFIFNLRRAQMFPGEYELPGSLSNVIIERIIKNNLHFNTFLLLHSFLLGKNKKLIYIAIFFRLFISMALGSRWQSMFDLMSLLFIAIIIHQVSFRKILILFSLAVIFFIFAGAVRTESGFGLKMLNMYIFGGLPAFGQLYLNPESFYLPKTFFYVESLIGLNDDVYSLVGDSVWINYYDGISTNTFTVFGVIYKYFGVIGSILYMSLFSLCVSYLYRYRFNNSVLSVVYYLTLPAVIMSIFTESFMSLAHLYVRMVIFYLVLNLFLRLKIES